jgi:hypothetical protein
MPDTPMPDTPMPDFPIKLGSMLFTMVEPSRGHEVAYNRWYERDHFYAGCMIGEWTFAGQRWVATRDLKALRYPKQPNIMTPDPATGSFLALYWILAGHYDEWNRWAVDQVKRLHADGRMFAQREHIHTLMYGYDWGVQRDPSGVSPELALDHRFAGLVVVAGEAVEGAQGGGDQRDGLDRWYRDEHLPAVLPGSSVSLCLSFTPRPLLADAPGVPHAEPPAGRFLHLYFLDSPAADVWEETFAGHGEALAASGLGRLLWAAPFRPTIPGTDTYTDELW